MKKILILIKIIFICFLFTKTVIAKEAIYYQKGKEFFQKKEFDKSKILFERDIVFNPKSEKSYLYLAKIFNINENDIEEEINLNSVLLLNPKNEEAIYMLVILKIKQSDYNQAKELLDRFDLACQSLCSKKKDIKEKFDKINTENAKSNN
jgi:tetratricopeptide (TPR) repeat protein